MWINFEGIDGSGKTTVSNRVAEELRRRGRRVVHAREDGRFASAIAGRVRNLVRSTDCLGLAPEAELLLNLAREAQLVAEVIRPALEQGAWVVTDRTVYSHLGLARHVRGLFGGAVDASAGLATQGLAPDRVFFIDVDPDIARWRKRIRKIRERRFVESGRKGLLGESLAWKTRRAFCEFAADLRWTVVDNTWRTLDATVREVLAALDGRARTPVNQEPFEADGEDLAGSYFRFVDSLGDRSLAAVLVAGLDDPRADEIRRTAPADEAAASVTGMDTAAAWSLREDLRRQAPFAVARSLIGRIGEAQGWRMRRELADSAPEGVLHSLQGAATSDAHGLRRRFWNDHRERALASLKGLDDAGSWAFREQARADAGSPMLAESLAGLESPRTWELRSDLAEEFSLAVLRSVEGVNHPRAWEIRTRFARMAPKVALATIQGIDGARADAIREVFRDIAPEETASSLAGIDTPSSWRQREELKELAPVGVLKSLRGADRTKGEALAGGILRRNPGRLRVAREALQYRMEPTCTPTST